MASFLLDDDLPEVEVDVERTGSYPEGFSGFFLPQVNVAARGFAQAFELRFPVVDPNDLFINGSSKYLAVLLPDGKSIRVTVPAIPSYFHRDYTNMLRAEAEEAEKEELFCANSHEVATAYALKVLGTPHLQTRSFVIQLSKTCRVLDERFGVLGGQSFLRGHELKAHYYMFDTDFAGVKWPVCYFYWRVQIEDTYENLAAESTSEKATMLLGKMQRLSLLGKEKLKDNLGTAPGSLVNIDVKDLMPLFESSGSPAKSQTAYFSLPVRPDLPSFTEGAGVRSMPSTIDVRCRALKKHRIQLCKLKEKEQQIRRTAYDRADELQDEEEQLQEEKDKIQKQIDQKQFDLAFLEAYAIDRRKEVEMLHGRLRDMTMEEELLLEERKCLARQTEQKEAEIVLLEKKLTDQTEDNRQKHARMAELAQKEHSLRIDEEQMIRELADYDKQIHQRQDNVMLLEHQAAKRNEENRERQKQLRQLIQGEQRLQFEISLKSEELTRHEIEISHKLRNVALLENQATEQRKNHDQQSTLLYNATIQQHALELELEYKRQMQIDLPNSEAGRPHCTDMIPSLALDPLSEQVVRFHGKKKRRHCHAVDVD